MTLMEIVIINDSKNLVGLLLMPINAVSSWIMAFHTILALNNNKGNDNNKSNKKNNINNNKIL